MGNYSRDTFDPTKNYVAVRMQQGVPLVDADWNEMNDITRNELYDGLGTAFPDGVPPGSKDLKIRENTGFDNDLFMGPGSVLIGGRPLTVRDYFKYTDQPWIKLERANRDDVAVIPPLTTPSADKEYIVYLDVWELEVDSSSTGDRTLINSAIGIETCVRLKREFVFRVAENKQAKGIRLPIPPSGHYFMPLALLKRKAGLAKITQDQIIDIRPFLHSTKGIREASFLPNFLPVGMIVFGYHDSIVNNPWQISYAITSTNLPAYKFFAFKPMNINFVEGVLPLVLPDGAQMKTLNIRGYAEARLYFSLLRIRHQSAYDTKLIELVDELLNISLDPQAPLTNPIIDRDFKIDLDKSRVDNSLYYYCLLASAYGLKIAEIHGISIEYE